MSRSRCFTSMLSPQRKMQGALIFQSAISDQIWDRSPAASCPGAAGRPGCAERAGRAPGAALGPWSVPGPRSVLGSRRPRAPRAGPGRTAAAPGRRSHPARSGKRPPAEAGLHLPAGNAVVLGRGETRRSAGSSEGRRGKRLWRGARGESPVRRGAGPPAAPRRGLKGSAAPGERPRPAPRGSREGLPGGRSGALEDTWRTQLRSAALAQPPAARGPLSPCSGPGDAPLSCLPALGSSRLPGLFLSRARWAAAGQEPLLAAAGGLPAAWSPAALALLAAFSWRVALIDPGSWAWEGTVESENCWPESHRQLKVIWTALKPGLAKLQCWHRQMCRTTSAKFWWVQAEKSSLLLPWQSWTQALSIKWISKSICCVRVCFKLTGSRSDF